MDNMVYKEGMCKMRSIHKANDFCNEPTVKGGEYCREHTCIIEGCKEGMVVEYPLLPGQPRFCSEHHTQEVAGKYGCDLSPSDFTLAEMGNDW